MHLRARFRSTFATLTGALLLTSIGACAKGSSNGSGTSEAPAASAAPAAPAPTPEAVAHQDTVTSGFGVPLSPNKCPSAAPGSTTTVKELPDGVEVTVLAPGGPPINDIRQRGMQIVAAAKDPTTNGGSMADGLAKCPIVVKDAIVTETDVPGGAAFTIRPTKAAALADLKKETKSRASGYVTETAK